MLCPVVNFWLNGIHCIPIEMPFGTETWVDTSNIVLEGGRDPPTVGGVRGGGNFRHNGKDWQRKV